MKPRISFQIAALLDALEACLPEDRFQLIHREAQRQRAAGKPEQKRLLWLAKELLSAISEGVNQP